MKHEGLIMKKGKYNFEIWSHRSLSIFQLKIIKKGKTLCALQGKVLRDKLPGARGQKIEGVSDEDTFKIKRIPAENITRIIFQFGELSYLFPGQVIRFELGYE